MDLRTTVNLCLIKCGQLNWDTVSQPVNDLFEPEIQPNFGPFPTQKSLKVLRRIQFKAGIIYVQISLVIYPRIKYIL